MECVGRIKLKTVDMLMLEKVKLGINSVSKGV